jgi:hypothetical protein
MSTLRAVLRASPFLPVGWALRRLGRLLPKGLYARSLIIIIAPVVLLQSVIAYAFMERHWELVTKRLSSAVTADIAALIDIYESYPQERDAATLARIASERLSLDVDILRDTDLPPPAPKPFFSILDEALAQELSQKIDPTLLDRHGGPVELHRDPGQAQRRVMRVWRGAARPMPRTRTSSSYGWGLVPRPARGGDPVPAQPDPPHPALAEAAESFGKGATSSSGPAAPGRSARRATPSSR